MADGMIPPVKSPVKAETSRHLVEFLQLLPDGRPPKRADKAAGGAIPARALRYCEAFRTATSFGYWLFPPMDLQLLWDGEQIFWSYGNAAAWLPLSGTSSGAVQYPGFAAQFDEAAPEGVAGFSPPFLTALPEPGSVQLWTGLVGRTRPGWSLMVRQPANIPSTPGIVQWEGIVEADTWFGPIFAIMRLTKTDVPIRLRAHIPFMQVQPIPQLAYRDDMLNDFSVKGLDDMDETDWNDLGRVLTRNSESEDPLGNYAVQIRKRRSCPFHNQMLDESLEDAK